MKITCDNVNSFINNVMSIFHVTQRTVQELKKDECAEMHKSVYLATNAPRKFT
jgi:hypothetical protein